MHPSLRKLQSRIDEVCGLSAANHNIGRQCIAPSWSKSDRSLRGNAKFNRTTPPTYPRTQITACDDGSRLSIAKHQPHYFCIRVSLLDRMSSYALRVGVWGYRPVLVKPHMFRTLHVHVHTLDVLYLLHAMIRKHPEGKRVICTCFINCVVAVHSLQHGIRPLFADD